MATEDDVRRTCLAFDGVTERLSWGQPAWFARTLMARMWDDGVLTVKSTERDVLAGADPETFFWTPHHERSPDLVLVRLDRVTRDELRELLEEEARKKKIREEQIRQAREAEAERQEEARREAEAQAKADAARSRASTSDDSSRSSGGSSSGSAPTTSSQPAQPPAPSSSSVLARPVNGPVTSEFGMRFHPILAYSRLHSGRDYGASCGTPVYAAAAGTILRAGTAGGYGNQIVVSHGVIGGSLLSTSYNHLSSFARTSGSVSRGQVIGYIGTTGTSTGCHLHFETHQNGTAVDPRRYL